MAEAPAAQKRDEERGSSAAPGAVETSSLPRRETSERKLRKLIVSALGLLVAFWAVMCIGGLIFMSVESPEAEKNIDQLKQDLAEVEAYFGNDEEVLNFLRNKFYVFDSSLYENPWTFFGSTTFSFTLSTTIGYGTFAPSTSAGKIMVIVFIFLTIPLAGTTIVISSRALVGSMSYLWSLGLSKDKQIRDAFRAFDKNLQSNNGGDAPQGDHSLDASELRSLLRECGVRLDKDQVAKVLRDVDKDGDNQLGEEEFIALVKSMHIDTASAAMQRRTLRVVIGTIVMWVGLGILSVALAEKWSFLEAVYFIVVTLSTVGLGDYFPATDGGVVLMFSFSLVGLGLLTMFFAIEEKEMKKAAKVMGQRIRRASSNLETHMKRRLSSSSSQRNTTVGPSPIQRLA